MSGVGIIPLPNRPCNAMNIVMVHGGVESNTASPYMKVLQEAALRGTEALQSSPLDAAEEAVKVLEDSPLFNAGYGSVLNLDGQAEMDASIVDGATSRFGAVAALRDIKNPVSVARRVLEETSHVLLAGEGAFKFAIAQGFQQYNCVTPDMEKAWQKAVHSRKSGDFDEASLFTGMPLPTKSCDTVGCVINHQGRTVAASSTGGSFLKLPGRVGDTPIIGGGIYASIRCAVVCTGLGEAFAETLTAKHVDTLLEQGLHPQEAASQAMVRLTQEKSAVGGLLVVDSLGRWGAAHNALSFPVVLMVDGKQKDYQPVKV